MRFLIGLMLIGASLYGEDFKAEITLSNKGMTIEDQLSIVVRFEHPPNYTPDINMMRANLLQHMGLSEPPFILVSSDYTDNKATFILEPQIGGEHAVTFYEIPFIGEDTVEVISDIFEVEVTIPPWNRQYAGLIAPPISLTERYPIEMDLSNRKVAHAMVVAQEKYRMATFPWIYVAGVILFGLLYLIARQQPKVEIEWEEELRRRLALAKKRALRKIKILSPQKIPLEDYYTELTDTVRSYIEERFQVHAPTQTTQEFLQAMSTHPSFDRNTQTMLSHFLISSDRVKFAEHEPSLEECKEAQQTAKQFIQQS